ncbi:hypothetical protein FSP39_022049 [Pinctada imbricata]|uniref:SCP domain-containing protein n=1 Tax=Pinctada imbricata TaxID=66713 RepID=A0AA88YKF7_PINIB|nr:hypothetical protein FSP39_022049 [Pinctada imbricata]
MCMNLPDWPSCVQKWFDEESDFRYGAGFNELNYGSVGHFVQIAYWKSARVGCGYATCGCYKYFVCEYAEALLFTPSVYSPWSQGEPCADCPDRCDDGLCDCSGKLCSNMGELKVDTCDCVCYTQAYSGNMCQNLNCGVQDDFMCAQMNVTFCRDVPNIYSLCPIMCSRCPA